MSTPHKYLVRNRKESHRQGRRQLAGFDGLTVDVLYLQAGETVQESTTTETAWLLMSGTVRIDIGNGPVTLERNSLFDESASAVHVSAATSVKLTAVSNCEMTVYQCRNSKEFAGRIITADEVPNEHRGKGQVAGRCLRFVRTIFDGSSAPANAELVLGEVVTLPGGWSSYPPHHHRQPEIYHYRFTEPQGFGHAELGDDVLKVRDGDTVCITPGLDHAQCAAPGYGMYYSWVIRHLPDDPYTVPDFTEEHAWTMSQDAKYWWPDDIARD